MSSMTLMQDEMRESSTSTVTRDTYSRTGNSREKLGELVCTCSNILQQIFQLCFSKFCPKDLPGLQKTVALLSSICKSVQCLSVQFCTSQ